MLIWGFHLLCDYNVVAVCGRCEGLSGWQRMSPNRSAPPWLHECEKLMTYFLSFLQVSSMDFMAMKRSQMYGMANNPYSNPQQAGGGPYPPSQPYTSPPHRYPMNMQGRGQMGIGGMQYPQQQVCQQALTLHLYTCNVSVWFMNLSL